jgi:hypothetical protein
MGVKRVQSIEVTEGEVTLEYDGLNGHVRVVLHDGPLKQDGIERELCHLSPGLFEDLAIAVVTLHEELKKGAHG